MFHWTRRWQTFSRHCEAKCELSLTIFCVQLSCVHVSAFHVNACTEASELRAYLTTNGNCSDRKSKQSCITTSTELERSEQKLGNFELLRSATAVSSRFVLRGKEGKIRQSPWDPGVPFWWKDPFFSAYFSFGLTQEVEKGATQRTQ